MAVIDDVQPGGLVIELNRRQVGLFGITDVDRRLAVPILARSKLRFEITPMAGPFRFAVVPCVLRMMLRYCTGGCENHRAKDDCRERIVPNLHMPSNKRAFH